ncbi:MAG TPA: bifunctional adenosylcobinamide kinase/adenosylcobinamide-phosphate guanylyltransferase [Coleofasciculaceae cyanobacterium]
MFGTSSNEELGPSGIILVTGAARSGKSEWAEHLALQSGLAVTYVATARSDPTDQEWQQRIARHRQRRPSHWETVLAPFSLAQVIATSASDRCLLIDSLGTWLANQVEADELSWQLTAQELVSGLQTAEGLVILVAEEVGWGVVPPYPIGRVFRDRLGDLIRQIGAMADSAYLVTGGYALNLTNLGYPLPGKRAAAEGT